MILKKLAIESSDTVNEIIKTIYSHTTPRTHYGDTHFKGYISGSEFNVSQCRNFRSVFYVVLDPIIEGKVLEYKGKTLIDASIKLSVFNCLFFLLPCLLFPSIWYFDDHDFIKALESITFFLVPFFVYMTVSIKMRVNKITNLFMLLISKHVSDGAKNKHFP